MQTTVKRTYHLETLPRAEQGEIRELVGSIARKGLTLEKHFEAYAEEIDVDAVLAKLDELREAEIKLRVKLGLSAA